VAEKQPKAMRVIVGVMLMAAFFLITFGLLTRYAGSWGVPYFSYTSDRGSTCTNSFTGYTCEPLTLADVEFYLGTDLPNDTRVDAAAYTATHDYTLTANLRMTARSQAAGLKALQSEYGSCQPDHPSPIPTTGLSQFCVLSNDSGVTRSGEPPSSLYVIGTGVAKNGTRVVSVTLRSR
jgi:hypothetical protein